MARANFDNAVGVEIPVDEATSSLPSRIVEPRPGARRSAQTLPGLVGRLRARAGRDASRGEPASAGHAGLLAANWREAGPHAYEISDPQRCTVVFFLREADVEFAANSEVFGATSDGDLIVILPPDRSVAWWCRSSMEYLQVCFGVAAAAKTPAHRAVFSSRLEDATLHGIGLMLSNVLATTRRLDFFEASAWSTVLRCHLARTYDLGLPGRCSTLPAERIRSVVRFIDGNLRQPLTVSRLAEIAAMSRSKFAQVFKVSVGLSPHQYVLARRVEKAKALIGSSADALADVAAAVGFSSQSHMTSTFRRFTGDTPQGYRKGRGDVAHDGVGASVSACE